MFFVDFRKKRKDYAFWRQFNEKENIVPGCPVVNLTYFEKKADYMQVVKPCKWFL